jgi:hypothetical protein
MDFCFDLNKSIHLRNKTGGRLSLPVSLIGMAYSCDAMEQLLEVAFELNSAVHEPGEQSDVLQQIVRKYEELWKIADAVVNDSKPQ